MALDLSIVDTLGVADSARVERVDLPGARLAQMNMVIAETVEVSAGMDAIVGPMVAFTGYRSNEHDVLVAEERTIGAVMDILSVRGVKASMGVLIQGTWDRFLGMEVHVRSDALQVGASAVYNPEGDEVESVLYVEDGEVLHPEFIRRMTARLLFKGLHDLGTVAFDRENGAADGTVTLLWNAPAHRDQLSVRFQGNLDQLGDVDFTVPVQDEAEAGVPLGENTLEGVDAVAPRTEPSSYQSATRVLAEAPIDAAEALVDLVLFRLNLLSRYGFLEVGSGPIDYEGGGNRLLSSLMNDGTFVRQEKDEFPPDINAHTRIEDQATNLLTNSEFSAAIGATTPTGWTVSGGASLTLLPTMEIEASGVGILAARAYGSGPYVGPKEMAVAHDDVVTIGDANPVTFSVLARTELKDPEVLVKTLRMVMSFRDGGDVEIAKQTMEFDPESIRGDTFVLLSQTEAPPGGTQGVRVSVALESIEASDDITLRLMGPQLELGQVATSRVVGSGPVGRSSDLLRFPQRGNLGLDRGAAIVIFAADYDDQPAADACIFDTRDGAGLNGFAAFHLANGRLRFMVAGPVSSKTLETNASFDFQAGIFQEVEVDWREGLTQIRYNGTRVALDDTAVVLPQGLQPWVWLFRTTGNLNRLNGELASFEIRRDFET